ncbi:MAG: DUF1465 family protein [Alphaproteobacteria bacterium]
MTAGMVPTAFFSKTFDETVDLLVEARNYIAYEETADRSSMDPLTRLMLSCEATRMTARLAHVMSWLLFRKAVTAGEIGAEEGAAPAFRLGGHEACLSAGFAHGADFPPRFAELLERSRSLYVRISRLDALIDGGATTRGAGDGGEERPI